MAHRMHHRPPGNCNYAGVFIIWDRIFGTYQAEVVRKEVFLWVVLRTLKDGVFASVCSVSGQSAGPDLYARINTCTAATLCVFHLVHY